MTTTRTVKDKTAIVGVAVSEFSRDSGRTEYSLAAQVVRDAVVDSGLSFDEIDGIVKDISDGIDPMYLQKAVGIEHAQFASDSHWGTSAIVSGITAVAAGICKNVVYYRSVNGASKRRAGNDFRAAKEMQDESLDLLRYDFYSPFGLLTPSGMAALCARRYLHRYGVDMSDLAWIPAVASEYAAANPRSAFFEKPMSFEECADSPAEVDPLRAVDCAPDVDGAVALVITSAERAKDLPHPPAIVMAAAQATSTEGELFSSFNRPDITGLPEMKLMGDELFRVAGVQRSDVKAAQFDDRFSFLVAMQLEELGYCERGDGGAFCAKGERIRRDGDLPLNTNGGFLGEGFLYGANVIEAVRQIRGTSSSQVENADLVLVASGAGGPADGLLLRR